jgi:signal transduction histidine kinase
LHECPSLAIQAILSGLQVAGEENPSQLMDDMYRAATILHAVINDTIDFVRIGSQRFEANIQPVRLIDVLVLCQRMYWCVKWLIRVMRKLLFTKAAYDSGRLVFAG